MKNLILEKYIKLLSEEDYKAGIFKEKYKDWKIYLSRSGDWLPSTHIDSQRYDRSMNGFDEVALINSIKNMIEELFYTDKNSLKEPRNIESILKYNKLKNRQVNGFVKVCLYLKKYRVKIIVDTFNSVSEKYVVIRTILKKEYNDDGEIHPVLYEHNDYLFVVI